MHCRIVLSTVGGREGGEREREGGGGCIPGRESSKVNENYL